MNSIRKIKNKHCLNFKFIKLFNNSLRSLSTNLFQIHDEVFEALQNHRPVVALESTIITHGMPFPDNIQCAKDVEAIIRQQGVVPATIAILYGKIKIGLCAKEMEFLGDTNISKPIKTSRRDIPYVLSTNNNGGTTVSGTLVIANKAGIKIFATGGIGGVHRNVDETLDISADLIELGKTGMAVVSGGVKSILDIPKTLEFLETQGVFVATYGPTRDFPAFYSSISGYKSPYNVETASRAAEIITNNRILNMKSGMLFAVPVPEQYSIPNGLINRIIGNALEKAYKLNVTGKDVTPFLLNEIAKLTEGKSLHTNVELIKNNAKVAANIAVELEKMSAKLDDGVGSGRPIIIGGSNLDCTVKLSTPEIELDGRMNTGAFNYMPGGVGRNICEALYKLNVNTHFLTSVGNDEQGNVLKSHIPRDCSKYVKTIENARTSQCIVVLNSNGDCPLLMGDMDIHQSITSQMILEHENLIKNAPLMVLDGNLTTNSMDCALKLATEHQIPVFFEPTDALIAWKPFSTSHWQSIKYITPNLLEAKEILKHLNCNMDKDYKNEIEEAAHLAHLLASNYIEVVIITLGSDGLLIASRREANEQFLLNESHSHNTVHVRHYPVNKLLNVTSVVGAGDCLASGLIAGMLSGYSEEVCVNIGFKCAEVALKTPSAIPNKFFDGTFNNWTTEKALYQTMCF